MTAHRAHPITDDDPDTLERWGIDEPDPGDAVLFDGCDRCEQHAADPLASLSGGHLAALWTEMVRVEHDPGERDWYRTRAESRACRKLYAVAVFLERNSPLDPWSWPLNDVDRSRLLALGGTL